MLPIKIISAIASVGGVGGAIGGIVHLTSGSKSQQGATLDQTTNLSGAGWRNYLVQAKTVKPAGISQLTNTCVFKNSCKVYSRQDGEDSLTITSNLTLVKNLTTITNNAYYVLSINYAPLKMNTLVEIGSTNQKVWVQITSKISAPSGKYKMPKPPKKTLPKSTWIDIAQINLSSPDELTKLQNRFFNNQNYPNSITREGVEHKSYMVLKWQETFGDDKSNSVHSNKRSISYIPKDYQDLPKRSQPTEVASDEQSGPFSFMPFMHPTALRPSSGQSQQTQPTLKDEDLVPVDSYLFKTFEEQQFEIDDQGTFELQFLKMTTGVVNASDTDKGEKFNNTFIEIYEISDQANIAKSFVSSPDNTDKSSTVSWDSIDKDAKMITKLSELKHDNYYKFVFSSEEVINKVFDINLTTFSGGLRSKTQKDRDNKFSYTGVFWFSNTFKDFYCMKKESQTKCQPFK